MTPFSKRHPTFHLSQSTSNGLKLLSAIMVVLTHYARYIWENHLSDSLIYHVLCCFGGFFAVALFFFLSGYGLMESEKRKHLDFLPYIKKRLVKVYFPAFLITFIWLPISSVLLNEDLTDGFRYLFWGFNDSAMWFIEAIMVLYIIFGVFIQLLYKMRKALSLLCLAAMTIVAIAFCLCFIQGTFSVISIPMFAIGVMTSMCNDSVRKMRGVLASVIGWGLGMTAFTYLWDTPYAKYTVMTYASFLIVMLVLWIWDIDFKAKCWTIAGMLSFDIYLVHNKVLTVMTSAHQEAPFLYYGLWVAVFTIVFYYLRKAIRV